MSEEVATVSQTSLNMKFYGQEMLLNKLIPWTGYNLLTRKGQTTIMNKNCLYIVGLLHGTNKLNYRENLLFYSVVKDRMPENVYIALYEKGNLVQNSSADATDTNLHLDEAVESGIILQTKMLRTNNARVLENSPLGSDGK